MKIGIALSGGGIRGIAHAGVLKALEDNGIKIDIIGGTSSGSLIASLYAMGYTPYYIYVLFKRYAGEIIAVENKQIISGIGGFLFNKKIQVTGLKSGKSLEEAYNELALKKGIKVMKEIQMPLVIPAVDMCSSKEYIFTSKIPNNEKASNNMENIKSDTMQQTTSYITDISVGKSVRASSSFPVAISPCEYNNHLFLDGGILNNIPVNEIKKQGADKVIAVNFDSQPVNKESNIMELMMKTLDIMGDKITDENMANTDYILSIPSDGTGLLDTSKLDFCYQCGYKTTITKMKELKQLLNK